MSSTLEPSSLERFDTNNKVMSTSHHCDLLTMSGCVHSIIDYIFGVLEMRRISHARETETGKTFIGYFARTTGGGSYVFDAIVLLGTTP